MERTHRRQVLTEALLKRGWEHDDAILVALPLPNDDRIPREIKILDPEPECLHQPQPATVEQTRDQRMGSGEVRENESNLLPAEDGGNTACAPGPYHLVNPAEINLQHAPKEEQKRAERLVLCGSRDASCGSEVREEAADLHRVHAGGVPLAVEHHKSIDPARVSPLGAQAQMPEAGGLSYLIQQSGGGHWGGPVGGVVSFSA